MPGQADQAGPLDRCWMDDFASASTWLGPEINAEILESQQTSRGQEDFSEARISRVRGINVDADISRFEGGFHSLRPEWPMCPSKQQEVNLDIVVERELQRMRSHPNRVDLLIDLVLDPAANERFGEHFSLQQE